MKPTEDDICTTVDGVTDELFKSEKTLAGTSQPINSETSTALTFEPSYPLGKWRSMSMPQKF